MAHRISGVLLTFALGALTLSWVGCGGEDGGGTYACSYEERRTDGCDGYGFGEWLYECQEFNADDYYITPSEVCANLTDDGLYCSAGCCIDYEVRAVDLSPGTCD